MDYEIERLLDHKLQQDERQRERRQSHTMVPHIKMFVSDWFTDELGNRARIVKACD
jgi:hypothetical protein